MFVICLAFSSKLGVFFAILIAILIANKVRLIWYIVECATEQVEDQKKGVVAILGVSIAPPALKYENRKLQSMILRMVNESLPHRVVAIVRSKQKTFSHHYR